MKLFPILLFAILMSGCYDRAQFIGHDVQPGQVWVQDSVDPFRPKKDTNTVLEVRGDWVKYRTDGGFTNTTMAWVFTHRARALRQ